MSLAGPGGAPVTLAQPPSSVDATVSQPVPSLTDGAYTLSYEVVAQDGHPLTGTLAFTVALPVAETTTSAPRTTTDSPTGSSSATDTEPAAQETEDGASPLWWIIGAVVVLAVVGLVLARRRRSS